MNDHLRAHVLTGVPVIAGGVEPETDPATGLPLPEEVPTDDPAQDGQIAEQPSVNTGGFSYGDAVRYVNTAATVQEKTGTKVGGIDWKKISAAMAAGGAVGALGGPVGAVIGAVFGALAYLTDVVNAGYDNAMSQMFGSGAISEIRQRYLPEAFWAWQMANRQDMNTATVSQYAVFVAGMLLEAPEDPYTIDGNAANAVAYLSLTTGTADGYLQPKHRVFVDTDQPLWRNAAGTWIKSGDLLDLMGGFDVANEFYSGLGIDYPVTRLEANPAGSESAAVPGQVSTGEGGVYMRKAGIYTYTGFVQPEGETGEGGAEDDASASGSGSGTGAALAAGLVLLAVATKKPRTRKNR